MVIAHNISAINTYNKMGISANQTNKSMEKLSSGYKINRAADDAAGLSISEKMRSQIRGLNQASENAQNGISMIQTAEGALNEAHSICQRMRELAVQAANDTNAASDREALQSEINQLTGEINRIGNTTEFNGMKLLNGSKVKITGKEEIEIAGKEGTTVDGTAYHNFSKEKAVNTAKLDFTQNITFAATGDVNFDQLQAKEGVNTVTVSKKNGKLYAQIDLVEAKGTGATNGILPGTNEVHYEPQELIQDENGDWTYNNHGVSFKISKDSAQKFITNGDETDVTKIDLFNTAFDSADNILKVASKSFGVKNDYNEGSSKNITIQDTTFKLKPWTSTTGQARIDYDRVEIEFQNAAAGSSSELVVKFFNGSDVVITDNVKAEGTAGTAKTVTYDANGLEFKVDVAAAASASDKMSISVDLDKIYGVSTVDGSGQASDNSVYFHVGANTNQVINTTFGDMRAHALGLTGTGSAYTDEYSVNNGTDSELTERGLNISTRAGANEAIDIIDNAVTLISQERSKYGAIQNRLEYTINNVDTTAENMTNAESTIRDTDMASEMMDLTKNQILQQASQAMLSQAMQRPQQVLQLLQQ